MDDEFGAGKKFAQDKVLKLMNEVIREYKLQQIRMDCPSAEIAKAQLNAVEFMKKWVCSGGHQDKVKQFQNDLHKQDDYVTKASINNDY